MSVRFNFDNSVEAALSSQVTREIQAGFNYSAIASYFGRPDVNLPGLTKWAQDSIKSELTHAQNLTDYLLQRGGRTSIGDVSKPGKTEFASGLEAAEFAVDIQKQAYGAIEEALKLAREKNDHQTADFLNGMLKHTMEDVVDAANIAAGFRRCGAGAGEQHFDKQILEKQKGCVIM